MANRQLPDFLTAENELNGQELAYIAQNGKTRKSTLQKIKEFIIGTTTMGTSATDITGAVKEINDKVGEIDVENDGDIATQLNDMASYGNYAIVNNISIPTGIETLIPLNLVIQSNDFFELVEGKIKILKKGTYLVSSAFSWEAKSSVGVRFIQVYVNNIYVRTNTANPVKDNGLSLQSVDLFDFNVGDILHFNATQNSGESINILVTNAHETKVKIKRVG